MIGKTSEGVPCSFAYSSLVVQGHLAVFLLLTFKCLNGLAPNYLID